MVFITVLILFEKGTGYGYKEKETGEVVISPIYENGKEYPIVIKKENYLAVKKHGKWGLINSGNEVVIDFYFDDIGRPRLEKGSPEFIQCFLQKGEGYFKIGIISTKLRITVAPILDRYPENITVLGENTCWYYINKGKKWGAVKSDGTLVMEMEYTKEEVHNRITDLCNKLIMEYKDHKEGDCTWIRNAMQSKEYADLFEWK